MKLGMVFVSLVVALLANNAGAQNIINAAGLTNPNAAPAPNSGEIKIDNQRDGPSWVAATPIPEPMGLGQTTAVADATGTTVYSIGGGIGGTLTATNSVRAYYFPLGAWFDVAPIPATPGLRAFGSAVEVGGFIYVFGGFDGTTIRSTTWIYDETNDVWSTGANMPAPRFGSAVATDGSVIWVMGGFGGLMVGDETNTVWMYDPAADAFTTGFANLPTALGRIHAVELPDGNVHVFAGGFDGMNHFIYGTGTDSWVSAAPMPFGVTDPATVTDGNVIYLCGGGGPAPRGQGHTQIFDPGTGTWSQGPLMPAPAVDNTSGAILIDGNIYVVGGFNGMTTVSTNYSLTIF